MTKNKTLPHIKFDERNHVEKLLLAQLDWADWGITPFIQDLLTCKKCVTALLNDKEAVSL